ncbi:MAG TPA: transcriptional regulator, partial [Firmicutes bacterium]|nr:transcriptional regulator [Bacillota bacterium]
IESIKSTVRAGHGYSFLPYFTIKKDLFTKELKEIELNGVDLATSFSMVWKKEMGSTEVEQNFINFIKTEGVKAFC